MSNFAFNSAVPAGGQVANALAGSPFEFLGRDSKVAVALAVETAGFGTATANITFGAELQLQNGAIMSERVAGAGALIPDNVVVDDVGAAGDRLVIQLDNSDVAIRNVRGIVRILPIQ